MHAEDANTDVRGVDVGVGKPLGDRPAAVARAVGMCLPVYARAVEHAPERGEVLRLGLAASAVFLEDEPPTEACRSVRQVGLRKVRIERGRAVRYQHL